MRDQIGSANLIFVVAAVFFLMEYFSLASSSADSAYPTLFDA
jgi:hypothetical protein